MNPRNPIVALIGGLVFLGASFYFSRPFLLGGPREWIRSSIDRYERQAWWIGRNHWIIRTSSLLLIPTGLLALLQEAPRLARRDGDAFVGLVAGCGLLLMGLASFCCPAKLASWQCELMRANAM